MALINGLQMGVGKLILPPRRKPGSGPTPERGHCQGRAVDIPLPGL